MTDQTDYVLLDRYLAGDSASVERERVEQWIAADPSREATLEWMRSLRSAAERLPASWDADELWHGLEQRIQAPVVEPRAAAPRFGGMPARKSASWSIHLLRVAAVIALVIASAAVWRLASERGPRPEAVATRTYTTHRGERAVFSLIDGSRVTLGASSRLDVPDTYGARVRDVLLQGQAYFEVVSNPAKPFRVHAGRATTEVLGTKFDVRAYRDDSTIAVVVAEGTVALALADSVRAAVLHHGDLARLDRGGAVHVEHGILLDRYLAWTEGRLEFVNAPLRAVLPELDRWYDVDIRLGDPALAAQPLTASLGTESADEMLRLLEASLQVRAERQGRLVTLYPSQAR